MSNPIPAPKATVAVLRIAPRGASEPPITLTPAETALIASYDLANSRRYAGAAASDPLPSLVVPGPDGSEELAA